MLAEFTIADSREVAVYKGDNLISIGTISELADEFKVKKETVKFWMTPTSSKRDKGNRKIAFYI